MSSNAKRKKRLGFGVFRIKRGGLGKRMVVQIFSKEPIITHAYFNELNDELYKNVRNIQRHANASMEFSLPEITYQWEIHSPDEPNSLLVSKDENDGYSDTLRVIISEKGISIEAKELEKQVNIACLTATKTETAPIFENTALTLENIRATMHVRDVIDYTRCFFLDVIMANSLPISCVVKRYIEEHGFVNLFKKKVAFAIKNGRCSNRFPLPDKDADYVSFSSLCLENNDINFSNFIDLWDSFILSEFTDYLLSNDEICTIINSKDGHRNQINTTNLMSLLVNAESGVNIIILPYDRPNKKRHFLEAKSKYRFKSTSETHWHKQIGIVSWEKYKKDKNPLVDNKNVEPFKVFIHK